MAINKIKFAILSSADSGGCIISQRHRFGRTHHLLTGNYAEISISKRLNGNSMMSCGSSKSELAARKIADQGNMIGPNGGGR